MAVHAAAAGAAAAAVRDAAEKIPCATVHLLVGCALDDCQGYLTLGAVAQLVEHYVRNVGVEGSNPFCSTKLCMDPENLPVG